MKFIVTESQYDELLKSFGGLPKLEKIIYKFWDKTTPDLSETFKILALPKTHHVYRALMELLFEYHGKDKVFNEVKKFISDKKTHTISDCGTYNFDFNIVDYNIDKENRQVELSIIIDDINGEVTLIFDDGRTLSINDAMDDNDIGFEIRQEVTECLDDYFRDNVQNKFGIDFVFNYVERLSRSKK
jgi:hypothetical protein